MNPKIKKSTPIKPLTTSSIIILSFFLNLVALPQAFANEQTPWQSNAEGYLSTGLNWYYVMGYHFTPLVEGQVTQLGGYFNGTKTVKLFNKTTGELLASTTVTSANTWNYSSITPVDVQENNTYTVAVYLSGTGGSVRYQISPPLPRTYADIRIEGTTFAYQVPSDIRPTNSYSYHMYGQADIVFEPSTASADTTPPTGTILINANAALTNSANVTLTLSATDDSGTVSEMQFSNDNATYSPPQNYATSSSWTLSNADGTKTVYVKFKDPSGNWSDPVSDTIDLDTTPPVITFTSPVDGQTFGAE